MRLLKHYVNPTAEIKTVTVEGKEFTICKLPADLSVRLTFKLGLTIAPIMALLGEDINILEELPKLKIDDEKLSDVVISVVEMCQVVDAVTSRSRMVSFMENDIDDFKVALLLAFEFLKFNFDSFFANSPLAKKVQEEGINLQEMMQNQK